MCGSGSEYWRCDGIAFTFDITNRKSFEATKELHLITLKKDIDFYRDDKEWNNVVLVGTKLDLVQQRAVSVEEASEFAEEQGWSYVETSALERVNVDDPFVGLILQWEPK
eukprot:TRINITY_DN3369_c1_g1_i1.p1 TRINITY_DN3369_c1_g1~~TRINITY_DN3369_c1_g1_i1.p1  ORF type:complete len:110 (-),score=32.87 TRINITY_DN3369_c1_g1_i1:11-340(-)